MSSIAFIPPNQIPFNQNSLHIFCLSCRVPCSFRQTLPVNLPCGHTICQICFAVLHKCPLFCSKGAENPQVKSCKIHNKPIELFCVQDEQYLCFTCSQKSHHKHKTIPFADLQTKAKKLGNSVKEISQKKNLEKVQLINFLEEQRQNSKRQISETIDQYISHLQSLKKKQHKDADIAMLTQQNHFEHQLAQEQISKYYEGKTLTVEAWRRKPEENLAVDLIETSLDVDQDFANFDIWANSLQNEALFQIEEHSVEAKNSLEVIKTPEKVLKTLFAPAFSTQKTYPKVEKNYLISFLEEFGLTALDVILTGFLEISVSNPTKSFIPKFNPKSFNCSMQKLSLRCLNLPLTSFTTLCEIVQNINALEDLTLEFQQKITDQELAPLSHLMIYQKTLKNFNVTMDLTETSNESLRIFGQSFANLTNVFNFTMDNKGSQTIISFQRASSSSHTLEELSLKFNEKSTKIAEGFSQFLNDEACPKSKALRIFKLSLEKDFQSPHLLKSLASFLEDQTDLEEIDFEYECESSTEILSLLAAILNIIKDSSSLKKLGLSIGSPCSTFFLLKSLKALRKVQEFKLNFKCDKDFLENQILQEINRQLPLSRNLTKFALKFNGAKVSHSIIKNFLTETQKFKTLASLDIEFVDLLGLGLEEEQSLHHLMRQFSPYLSGKRMIKTPQKIAARVKGPTVIVLD